MDNDIFHNQEALSKVLTHKRFIHCLGVSDTCFSLAIRYDYPMEKAIMAGLLHDCAKDLTDEMFLSECFKYNIAVTEVEERRPDLLHAKLGAYYAANKYGIQDSEILSAIAYHTTGKPDMDLLEKILYVADYIEPNRSGEYIPNLNAIRKLAYVDLDKALYLITENVVKYLIETADNIDALTIATRDFYKNVIRAKSKADQKIGLEIRV
ncbi:MAG: bis(5'-nucleosyl)-tetraphosphatase (symmetrical) YqeK [Anaerocolumna sp.]